MTADSAPTSRVLAPMPSRWTVPSSLRSDQADGVIALCAEPLRAAGLLGVSELHTTCASAAQCWAATPAPKSAQLPRLPWVGPEYPSTRVVVVGLNAHSHAGLLDEFYCVAQGREQLALGRERFFGANGQAYSWFHYRAAAAAALLTAIVDGVTPEVPAPRRAAEALMRTALLQLVQCAPDDGGRRAPTPAMIARCPALIAWPTVEQLRPKLLAVLGTDARLSLESHYAANLEQVHALVYAGTVSIAGNDVFVVALRHPSSGFGGQSLKALRGLIATGAFPRTDPALLID